MLFMPDLSTPLMERTEPLSPLVSKLWETRKTIPAEAEEVAEAEEAVSLAATESQRREAEDKQLEKL